MKILGGVMYRMPEPDPTLRVMNWTLGQRKGTHAYQRDDAVGSASYGDGMPSMTYRV